MADYEHLEWEFTAPRQGSEKRLYKFDENYERLRAEGFDRNPFSWEVFSLLAKNLEGKLKGNLKAAAEDMLSGSGEWFALAFKVQKDVLLSYANPRGLVWHRDRYVGDNFSADAEEEFDIKGIPLQQWVDLARFGDKFAKRFYGGEFAGLPQAMREGNLRAQVVLPAEGNAWPVGRSDGYGRFDIVGCGCGSRASRGVCERSELRRAEHADAPAGRQSAKISSGNERLVAPTLEQVLAAAGANFELGKKAQGDAIAALYQKPRK